MVSAQVKFGNDARFRAGFTNDGGNPDPHLTNTKPCPMDLYFAALPFVCFWPSLCEKSHGCYDSFV